MTQAHEVVLDFPYKDGVLLGGQTKEDQKRDEVFFNETLAGDDIDRLFEPKVFTNWKKYNQNGEHKVLELSKNSDGTLNENLIIKGNNLIALHSLKEIYREKVKLIYIDPPYNTGTDGFGYNDRFNHATWLTFMKNRLEVAKEFLSKDGLLVVHIDDHEHAYLKVMLDEIMGRENFVNQYIWINNLKGRQIRNFGSPTTKEYLLSYSRNVEYVDKFLIKTYNAKTIMPDVYKGFDHEIKKDAIGEYIITNELFNTNSKFNENTRPHLVFTIFWNPNNNDIKIGEISSSSPSKGYVRIEPKRNNNGINRYHAWRWSRDKIIKEKHNLEFIQKANHWAIFTKRREFKETGFKDVISNISTKSGTDELKNLNLLKNFHYPKPEKLVYLFINSITNPNDIVLDFFLGSGTSAAVAHKMGRRYIGMEQMDYIDYIAVRRLKKVVEGEQGGVSKTVAWQGGGHFIYCELASNMETFIEKIKNANEDTAISLWKEMQTNPYILYDVASDEVKDHEFETLELKEKKEILRRIIDDNNLYISRSEMDNKDFEIQSKDKDLTKQFYRK